MHFPAVQQFASERRAIALIRAVPKIEASQYRFILIIRK
jgi:hypothetical protein